MLQNDNNGDEDVVASVSSITDLSGSLMTSTDGAIDRESLSQNSTRRFSSDATFSPATQNFRHHRGADVSPTVQDATPSSGYAFASIDRMKPSERKSSEDDGPNDQWKSPSTRSSASASIGIATSHNGAIDTAGKRDIADENVRKLAEKQTQRVSSLSEAVTSQMSHSSNSRFYETEPRKKSLLTLPIPDLLTLRLLAPSSALRQRRFRRPVPPRFSPSSQIFHTPAKDILFPSNQMPPSTFKQAPYPNIATGVPVLPLLGFNSPENAAGRNSYPGWILPQTIRSQQDVFSRQMPPGFAAFMQHSPPCLPQLPPWRSSYGIGPINPIVSAFSSCSVPPPNYFQPPITIHSGTATNVPVDDAATTSMKHITDMPGDIATYASGMKIVCQLPFFEYYDSRYSDTFSKT